MLITYIVEFVFFSVFCYLLHICLRRALYIHSSRCVWMLCQYIKLNLTHSHRESNLPFTFRLCCFFFSFIYCANVFLTFSRSVCGCVLCTRWSHVSCSPHTTLLYSHLYDVIVRCIVSRRAQTPSPCRREIAKAKPTTITIPTHRTVVWNVR